MVAQSPHRHARTLAPAQGPPARPVYLQALSPPAKTPPMPAQPVVAELITLLALERLEENLFRGQSRDIGSKAVFGGQVLGQALSAAQATVDPDSQRRAHSLHAYFLRAGDINAPIIYTVDRTRDGGSFSVRRVTAIQHGRAIFFCAASFQGDEDGVEHQAQMPQVPAPEDIIETPPAPPEVIATLPPKVQRWLNRELPFEFRHVQPRNELDPQPLPPQEQFWFRLTDKVGDSPELHRTLLAYASDYQLLGAANRPHGISYYQPNVQMASLDHALWFHRPFRADDWLLYAIDSPTAQNSRGMARGLIFDRAGRLVASTAQEGLIRVVATASDAAHVPAKE